MLIHHPLILIVLYGPPLLPTLQYFWHGGSTFAGYVSPLMSSLVSVNTNITIRKSKNGIAGLSNGGIVQGHSEHSTSASTPIQETSWPY